MNLRRVEIKNYRSIEELKLHFDLKCRILVGINESGKTNILNALNLLDPQAVTTRRDVREPRRHESSIGEAYVRFVFSFTPQEVGEITENVKKKILSKTYFSPIVRADGLDYALAPLCLSREGLYIADLLIPNKQVRTWALKDPQLLGGWKKVSAACPPTFEVSTVIRQKCC
jgi:hypothetical protein